MASKLSDIFKPDNISVFLSELLGTALLVFIGCAGCIPWDGHNFLQIVLTFGFAVLISVQIFGCVSGAHINPAVTLAAVVYKLISLRMACAYVVAQCVGAFIGYGLLVTLTPTSELPNDFCITKPNVPPQQAFFIEFIATATLVWFCCGIWDPRNGKVQDSVPLRFGLAVAGLASATGKFTGGSFNPARSLAPAYWNGNFESHWIYWAAPLSGALFASLVYKYVFHREVINTENYDYNLENVGGSNNKS